jgi:hypothetical protein
MSSFHKTASGVSVGIFVITFIAVIMLNIRMKANMQDVIDLCTTNPVVCYVLEDQVNTNIRTTNNLNIFAIITLVLCIIGMILLSVVCCNCINQTMQPVPIIIHNMIRRASAPNNVQQEPMRLAPSARQRSTEENLQQVIPLRQDYAYIPADAHNFPGRNVPLTYDS